MSAGVYKIEAARQGRTYTGKHGDLVVWLVKLENAQPETPTGEFELHKKPGNTPNPGDSIEVDRFSPGEHDGTPFIRIFAASQQGSTSSTAGGGGDKNFDRRPEHPRNEARMIHSAVLGNVPAFVEQMLTLNVIPQAPLTEQEYWALVSRVAKKLTVSYESPMGRASGPGSTAQNGATSQQEIPADTTDLQPAAAPVDESIPF